jgi:hypothetical protein
VGVGLKEINEAFRTVANLLATMSGLGRRIESDGAVHTDGRVEYPG